MGLGPHDGGGEEKVPRPPQFSDRIGDEVLVDLLKSGCGITYQDAIKDAVVEEMDGVQIPFASASTLWRMKQTPREKDEPDRLFLRELLTSQGISINLSRPTAPEDAVTRWLKRLQAWWQRASRLFGH